MTTNRESPFERRPGIDLGAHDFHDGGAIGTRVREDVRTGKLHADPARARDIDMQGNFPRVITNTGTSGGYNAYTVPVFPRQGNVPTQILGRENHRTKTILTNVGGSPIIIGSMSRVSNGVGYQINPGKDFSPTVSDELYAVVPDGSGGPTSLSVWVEWGESDS